MNGMEGRTWAEIQLDLLVENYQRVRKFAHNQEIMAAIKADAYGHGAIEVAKTLVQEGVDIFGVASAEEGIELRMAGVKTRILILSPILESQIDAVIEYDLMPTISELSFFKKLDKKLKHVRRPMLVHVEVDTGMTRTGFPYDETLEACGKIRRSPYIKIDGIFSHFPMADMDGAFSKKQIADFSQLIMRMDKAGERPRYVHIANSSGIFRYPASHYNLVRPGISLYGLTSSPTVQYPGGFRPVMSLRSRVVNLRNVNVSTPISYGHTFRAKRKSRIATLSVGYGDGYPRLLSNIGEVLCRGKRARIVGTVCMDLTMIDITDIPGVKVGEIVTLIGKDGKAEITVGELASKCKTIVYEITSGIGPRVARVFKNKNKIISTRNLLGRWKNYL